MREKILQDISLATGMKYPLRWASSDTARGTFDGFDRTIEVFNIELAARSEFLQASRTARKDAEKILGGPIVFVFHSRAATAKHYSHLIPTTVIQSAYFGPESHLKFQLVGC